MNEFKKEKESRTFHMQRMCSNSKPLNVCCLAWQNSLSCMPSDKYCSVSQGVVSIYHFVSLGIAISNSTSTHLLSLQRDNGTEKIGLTNIQCFEFFCCDLDLVLHNNPIC